MILSVVAALSSVALGLLMMNHLNVTGWRTTPVTVLSYATWAFPENSGTYGTSSEILPWICANRLVLVAAFVVDCSWVTKPSTWLLL